MDSTHPSWNEALVDVVIDFTEAAVHSLLHARKVYPQGARSAVKVPKAKDAEHNNELLYMLTRPPQ